MQVVVHSARGSDIARLGIHKEVLYIESCGFQLSTVLYIHKEETDINYSRKLFDFMSDTQRIWTVTPYMVKYLGFHPKSVMLEAPELITPEKYSISAMQENFRIDNGFGPNHTRQQREYA